MEVNYCMVNTNEPRLRDEVLELFLLLNFLISRSWATNSIRRRWMAVFVTVWVWGSLSLTVLVHDVILFHCVG
jgi:hypothetical protein